MKKNFLMSLLMLVLIFSLASCNKDDNIVIKLDKTAVELEVDETIKVNATISVEGLIIEWSTNNESVAKVSGGTITAVSAGVATITAKAGTASAKCEVTVIGKEVIDKTPKIIEEEGYNKEIYFFNNENPIDVDLCKGLSAVNYQGQPIDVVVADDDGFDVSEVGLYTVKYKAVDSVENVSAEFIRKAVVTYFGITDEMLNNKAASELVNWTYAPNTGEGTEQIRTADEWDRFVVPGHSADWNKFEGPVENCLIMHGSDTNGREEFGGEEADDENPNTILWNKLTVPKNSSCFRVFCSNNPYPDYNNLLSKIRLSVYDIKTKKFETIDSYRQIKAPLNANKDGLDYDYIRTLSYQDFDLSEYEGEDVILFIEQDAPADVYQADYYKDIGYLDFQIVPLIVETRDTLVIYSMQFIAGEEIIDYSGLTLDESISWGIEDKTDYSCWGLRGDETAKSKWTVKFLNGAQGILNNVTGTGASLQLISREEADTHDGKIIMRDAVLMNKILVGNNKFFEIYLGTDSDAVSVNYRLTFVVDGKEYHLKPLFKDGGYTSIGNAWGRIQKSQWVEGVKLIYDVSEFVNKEVIILIEQDENYEAGDGHCTLWFNKARLVEDMVFKPANYTEYNQLKTEIEETEYDANIYTEASWNIFQDALASFNGISSELVDEQQPIIDRAVANLKDAKNNLTLKPAPIVAPADTTSGILADDLLGFDTDTWLNLPVDASGVWGTSVNNLEYWGLRGDTSAKAMWKWYKAGNGSLYYADSLKASLQSIAYEGNNDTETDFGADAMFVNKVWVRGSFLRIFVGCDSANDSVNVRVRLILSNGEIVALSADKFSSEQATKSKGNWYRIQASQWVYGTALLFNISEYSNDIVTISIEQDQNETETGTTCTMWLNKVEIIAGADYSEYNNLKQAVEDANYMAEDYTEDSFAAYRQALNDFNSISKELTIYEQEVVNTAVSNLQKAIAGLSGKEEPQLTHAVGGFNNEEWKAMPVDNSTEWGALNEDAGQWGMRGDVEAKNKWRKYGTAREGEGIPVIVMDATDTENDDANPAANAVLANKVVVPEASTFNMWVGSDWSKTSVNVRLSVVLETGEIAVITPSKTEEGYTVGENGWGSVAISQWIYGTKVSYDLSAYKGQTVTILIEIDGHDIEESVLWFIRANFE